MLSVRSIAVLSAVVVGLGVGASAQAGPRVPVGVGANSAGDQVIKVGARRYHRNRGSYGEYGYVGGEHTHAPYTHVDSSRGRVVIDAPAAYVSRSRHGVRVQAPYVDIYIPRY